MNKDKFLNDIKEMNKESNKFEIKSFESIINNLFIENKHGKHKAMGLFEYDSESMSKNTLIPGHIYGFKYMTLNTTKYNDGKIKFEYTDLLPIILCLSTNKNLILGINLNLCNKALRTIILNIFYNIDPDFFDYKASYLAHHDLFPISKNISTFLSNKSNILLLFNNLINKYKLNNTGLIFRTYNIEKILNIRFIEPWQWKYIPFINYKQSVKEPILKLIHTITGIDKIKI